MLWTVFDSAESTEALRHPCSRRVHFKITIIVFAADVAARRDKSRHLIYLDTYMRCGVYEGSGICFRNHCGAEPPRDIEPPGLVTKVGWRDRASTSYVAADRVKAPASAARGRFRGIHGGRTASSLPTET